MSVLKTVRDGKAVAYRLDRAAVIIGRAPTCQIVIPDEGVLARQCQIVKLQEGFLLKDLSNGQGVVVNGKKVRERVLTEGDILQIGSQKLTFTGTMGQNTARIATPAAEAAPRTATGRQTAVRSASAPVAKKTASVPAAAPPTRRTSTGAVTQRAAVIPDGKAHTTTGGIKRKTGSMGTARMTGRVVKGPTATFSMPTTKKGKMIAIGGTLGIVAVAGILWMIFKSQDKPDEIRATLKKDVEAVAALPAADLAGKIARFRALAEDPKNQKFDTVMVGKIRKGIEALELQLKSKNAAEKECRPFVTRFKAAKAKGEDYGGEADTLYQEGNAIAGNHPGTGPGEEVVAIRDEIKKYLENRKVDNWNLHIIKLQSDTRELTSKGNCVGAMKLVDEFGEKYKETSDAELARKLTDQRDFVKRQGQADGYFARLKKEVKSLLDEGKKDEAKKKIEAAKPGLEGYPAGLLIPGLLKEIEDKKS